MMNLEFDDNIHFYWKLTEVPGAARVNLQHAEHFLFCKQFSKMCPSALRDSDPQRPRVGKGAGIKTATKPSLDSWGCGCKILSRSILAGVWICTSPSHTNRQTDAHFCI